MKKILLFAFTFIVAALVVSFVSASSDPIDPFDFEDCEDLSEIPPELEVGEVIPLVAYPGYTIDTTCGEAILGCILAPITPPISPETEFECVYVGPASCRCYWAMTSSYHE